MSTYILFIKVEGNRSVLVGRLGRLEFKRGIYLYVGSAQKGLEARIGRHLKKSKKLFWHIDYLLSQKNARVVEVWVGEGKGECLVARRINDLISTQVVRKFGSSDCRCSGHLFYLKNKASKVKSLLRKLGFEPQATRDKQ